MHALLDRVNKAFEMLNKQLDLTTIEYFNDQDGERLVFDGGWFEVMVAPCEEIQENDNDVVCWHDSFSPIVKLDVYEATTIRGDRWTPDDVDVSMVFSDVSAYKVVQYIVDRIMSVMVDGVFDTISMVEDEF